MNKLYALLLGALFAGAWGAAIGFVATWLWEKWYDREMRKLLEKYGDDL